MKASIILVIVLSVLLVGCSNAASEEKIQTAIAETQAAQPTDTPTLEPSSTKTIRPTFTPRATKTRIPTHTPRPTNTATPIPDPVIITGSGDMVVDVQNPFDIAVVHITGNAGGHHFAVTSLNRDGEYNDLIVNTTEPYDGIRPLDFGDKKTARFEVKAVGDWKIEILYVLETTRLLLPGKLTGIGDNVIFLFGSPDTAHITGNAEDHHFAVIGYGDSAKLLVNTTEPYDGTVLLDKSTVLLEIKATGEWTIDITIVK